MWNKTIRDVIDPDIAWIASSFAWNLPLWSSTASVSLAVPPVTFLNESRVIMGKLLVSQHNRLRMPPSTRRTNKHNYASITLTATTYQFDLGSCDLWNNTKYLYWSPPQVPGTEPKPLPLPSSTRSFCYSNTLSLTLVLDPGLSDPLELPRWRQCLLF